LPSLIEELEPRASKTLRAKLQLIALLKPGSFGVVHLSVNSDPNDRKVVEVELHSPVIRKKK
jgi:hypothetical protein